MKSDNKNGQRRYKFPDGRIYVGQFKDGKIHGEGKLTFPDGAIYVGQFKDGKIHGEGRYKFPDGTICEGQFKDGKIHGEGRYKLPDGTICEGQFKDGKIHGEGKLILPDGEIYEGQFLNGEKNGEGRCIFPDGRIYVGQFKDGKIHGEGKLILPDGRIYEGQFLNGEKHGEGKLTLPDGTICEGQFKDGKIHGEVRYIFPDGTICEGQFKDGKIHGEGKLTLPDGGIYVGQFENGKKHGKGKFRYPYGEIYGGTFKDNKMHGKGTLISPSGKIIVAGEYLEGRLSKIKLVMIKENENTYVFKWEEERLYYSKNNGEKVEIDTTKNKRIVSFLKQLGDIGMNRESDNDPNCIEITSPENFKTEIDKLSSQSIKSQEPIIKKIGIPGHAFDMAFIKGKYFCFDNGALKNFTQFKDYFDRIKEDEYGIFDLENKLTFEDVEGREITINLKKKDIVCRNSTTGIFQKLQELATTQPQIQSISDLVMAISEYCRGSSGEQKTLVRVNSFAQVSSGESEHCCQ